MKSANVILSFVILQALVSDGCRNRIAQRNHEVQNTETSGIASGYPNDLNIATDKEVIFSSSFENNFKGWTSACEVCDVVQGDSFPGKSKLLRITATKHLNTGGDVIFRFPKGEDEVYLRFYTWFSRTNVTPHHFVKIISYPVTYFGGMAGKKPGNNKYFVLGIEPTKNNQWNFYNYWQGMHSWQTYRGDPDSSRGPNAYYGNVFKPGNQQSFERNSWICVEAHVKLNDPGKSNGEMAFWINGVKTGEWKQGYPAGTWRGEHFISYGEGNTNAAPFEGFNFRTVDSLKINQVSLQWYVSEERANEGAAEKNIVYFDDIVIARKYIGIKR